MRLSRRAVGIIVGVLLVLASLGLAFAGAFCQWAEGWEADSDNPCPLWFAGAAATSVAAAATIVITRRR